MTPELLASIAAILLSLAASYLPWFAPWYQGLDSVLKRLLMLVLLATISITAYALACAGLAPHLSLALTCDSSGALDLFRTFLAALLANQATYQISKISPKSSPRR
jgi:hypothetical protein